MPFLGPTSSFCLVMVAICEPNRPGELDGCVPKVKFGKLLMEGAGGGGGGGSYLPLHGKTSVDGDGGGSGSGCLNGLKLEEPNPVAEPGARPGIGGRNGSKYGGKIGTTGGGKWS